MFNGNNLLHESLLTIGQKIKLRNTFENNISTDIKLSKAQISKIIENKIIEQKRGFWGILFGALGAILLGSMLTGKGILRTGYGNKEGKVNMRDGFGSKKKLVPSYPLTNIEIQKYYQNESRFNGVFSRDNLYGNIKDGAYVINLHEYADFRTQLIGLLCMR